MRSEIAHAMATVGTTIQSWFGRSPHLRRTAFIRAYNFPSGLDAKLRERYPEWDDAAVDIIQDGLREFMLLCLDARGRSVAMPSKAVDVAWHEFILFTRSYHEFCKHAFGFYLHHAPATPGSDDYTELCRAWALTCMRYGIDRKTPHELPLLFRIDRDLALANGAHFNLDDLAKLPLPYDIIETAPGQYHQLGPNRLNPRRRASRYALFSGIGCTAGSSIGCSSGHSGGGHGGGHSCSGGCSGGSGCSGGGGCGGGGS